MVVCGTNLEQHFHLTVSPRLPNTTVEVVFYHAHAYYGFLATTNNSLKELYVVPQSHASLPLCKDEAWQTYIHILPIRLSHARNYQQTAMATFFLSPFLHSLLCYQSLRFMKIGVGCLGVGLCSTLKWDSDFSHYFLIYFLFHSGVNIFWQWFDIVGWASASWKVICLARTANPMFGECFPPLPFFLHFHQQKLPRDDKV